MLKQVIKQHFNPYFFVPFILWCIIGALLLLTYSSTSLFTFINGHHHPITDVVFESVNHFGEAWLLIIVGFAFFLLKPFRNIWFFITTILCSTLPSIFTQLIKNPIAAPGSYTHLDVYKRQEDFYHNTSFRNSIHYGFLKSEFLLA